ncbi:MAG: pacearchaeosortase [Candidatus Pacearchaeota archaeon]|jgi:exosortase/archaeosortase family protein
MVKKRQREIQIKKKPQTKFSVVDLLVRYVIVLVSGLGGLFIFYAVFTPLTIYPVYAVLKICFGAILSAPTLIDIGNIHIELIEACIAGSAYYLLFILNLLTNMPLKKRIYSLVYSMLALLVLNILRILLLSVMLVQDLPYFDVTHKFFWYFLSTVFVVAIWFSSVWLFKIKEIPVYTDLRELINIIKLGYQKDSRKH